MEQCDRGRVHVISLFFRQKGHDKNPCLVICKDGTCMRYLLIISDRDHQKSIATTNQLSRATLSNSPFLVLKYL